MQVTSITCGVIINGYHMHWFTLKNAFAFTLDVTFIEFTYIPTFLSDYKSYDSLLVIYSNYLKLVCKKIFWINFDVFRKNFVILRVSGQNIIGKCYLNVCAAPIFSFLICKARG